jgi:hypothetical protein
VRRFSCFTVPKISILFLGLWLLWPGHASATTRHDSPKGNYGAGPDIFSTAASPVLFTLSDGSTLTLESSVRCVTTAASDCLSANSIYAYFYVLTVGSAPVSQKITLQVTAPFDTHNSSSLSWGIIDAVDPSTGAGTTIAACSTPACIDGVLTQSSSYQTGTLTFDLDPTTLSSSAFQPGDQIFLYATSFSPPKCAFDFSLGLSCDSTSLTGSSSLSASGGSLTPTNTPVLVPVLPAPGRRFLAPSEGIYFSPQVRFSGNSIEAQATQSGSNTLLPGFVVSSADSLGCAGCGSNGSNVSFGYIYNLQIPSTISIASLPSTISITLSAPFNQDNFEFLDFGVLGMDGSGSSSAVLNCAPTSAPNVYDACLDTIMTVAPVQPTSLTFMISTANLSPGDNLTLFATSNNNPNSCNTTTNVCTSSTPISLQGDATTTLSIATGSPNTVTGPSDPIPLPSISSLSPSSALQSSGAFTLTVSGLPIAPATDSFVAGAQVLWNGAARQTTLLSPTQLSAQILADDLDTGGTVPVTVVNPSNPSTTTTPNGGSSTASNFTVVAPNPSPILTSVSPTSANAGGPAFTLTLNGTGFVSSSQVNFNGKAEVTSFVSSTLLTAPITAPDIASAATVSVTVTNPMPGGGTSAPQTFNITSHVPSILSISPVGGTGLTQIFSIVIADPVGLLDLKTAHLLFNTSTSQASACSVYYAVGTNQLFLYNDGGTSYLTPVTPGSATTVSNSQCTLAGTGTSFSGAGNNLTLNVALTFNSTFVGSKNVYGYASGNDGLNTGWVQKGTWTPVIPQPPSVVSLTPNAGAGAAQTFSVVIADPVGLLDLKTAHLLFNTSTSQASACSVYYAVGTNQLFLYNDGGTSYLTPVTPGSATTVSNSQCTLAGTGTSFSGAGNNLTLNVALTFNNTFVGSKNVYGYASGNDGLNTGWVQKGTWNTGTPQPSTIASASPLPSSFFGMADMSNSVSHFPTVPFGALRLWDASVSWSDIEASQGAYNFTGLDSWLSEAYANNQTVLYTFGRVPTWAGGSASNNNPPSDISAGNVQFAAFVTALVQHSLASSTAKISYYELWDEPDSSLYWTGTEAQMVTMAQTAYNIIHSLDPNAIITGPGIAGSDDPPTVAWLSGYWAAGGSVYQDIVAYHAYTADTTVYPSYLPGLLSAIQTLQQRYSIASKPLWFTEGSWGNNLTLGPVGLTDEQKISYMAQQYLLSWGFGVGRYYWYQWDNSKGFGTLWSSGGGITPAGTAYGLLYSWLVGSTQTSPLSLSVDGTWSASLTLSDGRTAQIVWNPLISKSISTSFVNCLTLDGSSNPVSNGFVNIGNTPVMLVSPAIPAN